MASEAAAKSYAPFGATEPYTGLVGSVPAPELAQIRGEPLGTVEFCTG